MAEPPPPFPTLNMENSKIKLSALVEMVADMCKVSKLGNFDHFRVSAYTASGASQICQPSVPPIPANILSVGGQKSFWCICCI